MPRTSSAKNATKDMQAARAARYTATFELVRATDVEAEFSDRKQAQSIYLGAIQKLMLPENADQAAAFPANTSARAQLVKRAQELGVKLLFAESGGKIFAKLAPLPKVNEQILDFIKERPRTKNEIDSMVLNRKLEVNTTAELQNLSGIGMIHLGADSKWYARGHKPGVNGAGK